MQECKMKNNDDQAGLFEKISAIENRCDSAAYKIDEE
jgi:hypothetical protein